MKVWFNAVASTAGGGKNYLSRLLEDLRSRSGEFDVWVPKQFEPDRKPPKQVRLRTSNLAERGYLGRLIWEQVVLAQAARRSGADAIACLGNVCPLWSAVPTVLLSANAHYFCDHYVEDLRARGEFRRLAEHRLKTAIVVRSARAANAVVTPTQSMADTLIQAAGPLEPVVSFFGGLEAPATLQQGGGEPGTLLVLSHYNYFRNFETVFRAVAGLRRKGRDVRLLLTTRLERGLKQGGYDSTAAVELIDQLGISDAVETLGEVSRDELPGVISRAQIVICPGYVESFSFTLVEAMSAGVPVLASDIPTHREVGAAGAAYFSTFDAEDLADKCDQLIQSEPERAQMSAAGLERAKAFDWKTHFDRLFETIERVADTRNV